MGMIETTVDIPAEHQANVFGQFDAFAKKIERTLHVTLIARDDTVKILGEETVALQAKSVLEQLTALARRGNQIQEQNVNYTLALSMEQSEGKVLEIDDDIICHTLQGKPIKPKTLGQKKYVDAIRKQMIVFGLGPAGTGKSQIAYLVAKILKMPWTTLDMSSINDAEQLTGSSRIYSNAKPGIIMESFNMAGESNLVFIINELDKATSSNGNANPADVLLTLLDNLGFTDNYMECLIPTSGVYPIATANDKDKISAPLLSRFAVIDIPDYTREEKKTIFLKYSLPKVLKRIGLHEDECLVLDDGLEAVLDYCKDTTGIRDLEQAAEHLAAHALYLIEVEHATSISYNADMVKSLFR